MREIRSPLDGIPSPFTARAALDAYLVGAYSPKVVADFAGIYSANEYYRTGGSASTFSDMFSYTGASNKTMTDSDGKLKWAPHNLALNSAAPATQSITVVSGADYTVEITGSGSVALSGAGSGTVTAGNPVEITASTTTLTLTVTGTPTTMWAYRSDLGGMVNNPDRNDSYVPTTSSIVYLPRRNHYGWNGSSYVNKGLLLETESRTNIVTYSNDFSDVSWSKPSVTLTAGQDDPWGGSDATLLAATSSGYLGLAGAGGAGTWSWSIWAKAGSSNWLLLNIFQGTNKNVWFDLANGTVETETNGTGFIENYGGGWYRCTLIATTTASFTATVIPVDADGSATRSGNVVIYGAQLELGSTPSSYMPTTGSTFTRAPESLTIPAAKMAYDATNMSFQMQGVLTYADNNVNPEAIFFGWGSDGGTFIRTALATNSGTGLIVTNNRDSYGPLQTAFTAGSTMGPAGVETSYNFSARHTTTTVQIAFDGTSFAETPYSASLPDLSATNFSFGPSAGFTVPHMGTIALFRQDNNDWGDAGIEEAST